MNERFQFLKSYADSLNELAKADEQLAKDLAWKIIQYGIYWINDDSWNPIIEALFLQMKLAIDKGNDLTEKRRNANQKRTNIQQKWTKKEQKINKKEQTMNKQWTNNEQTAPKEKIENRKDKIENNINNNLKIISEDKSSQEYWDRNINLCLELIKKYNNGIIDWTIKNQRNFWKMLVDKLNKLDSVQDWRFTWDNTLEIILKIVSQNKYYSSKITSPEAIFRNLSLLMNVCKSDITKQQAENLILPTV